MQLAGIVKYKSAVYMRVGECFEPILAPYCDIWGIKSCDSKAMVGYFVSY
jgi:hypothetical protein